MAIKINGQDLLKRFINGQEIVRVYKNGGQIRPETVPPVFDDYLCFTAQESNSTVTLNFSGASAIRIEISYDKSTWMDYTIGGTIALSNVGDKVYMRNKSETPTGFSTPSLGYRFSMGGKIGASGDITSLLCKYATNVLPSDWCFNTLFRSCESLTTAPSLPATTLSYGCYVDMFHGCTSLTAAPQLPATTLADVCYYGMFDGCTSLTTAPQLTATTLAYRCYYRMFRGCTSLRTLISLPATELADECYRQMFANCSLIKLSENQIGDYQTSYRIPSSGTGVDASSTMGSMFLGTGGTFTGTPSINTTYYTSNQVI